MSFCNTRLLKYRIFLYLLAPLGEGHTAPLHKALVEIRVIQISARIKDLPDALGGGLKKVFCPLDARVVDIAHRGDPKLAVEDANDIGFTVMELLAKIGK